MFILKNLTWSQWLNRILYLNVFLSVGVAIWTIIKSPELSNFQQAPSQQNIQALNHKTDEILLLLLGAATSGFGIKLCNAKTTAYWGVLEDLKMNPKLESFPSDESTLSIQEIQEIRATILDSLEVAAQHTISREEADELYLKASSVIPVAHSPKVAAYISHIILKIAIANRSDLLEQLTRDLNKCKRTKEVEQLVNRICQQSESNILR